MVKIYYEGGSMQTGNVHFLDSDFPLPLSRSAIRAQQYASGKVPCFQTDLRNICKKETCEWQKECRRLIAYWLR